MNITTVYFAAGSRYATAKTNLWQWDQGQILQIVGLDLPDAYQVEFSNQPVRGTAAPMIGGVDGVEIPDVYLTTGKPVYAFVVLHAGEDDRETEYKITIPVNARPQPTDVQPTPEQQSVIDQLIAALTAGVEKAEDAAAQAEEAIGYMPKIVDGTWWVYDAEAETWTDTGIQAEGQDGVGISGAVLNANYTLTLTFTDGSSYTTPPIRGAQGKQGPIGPTPDISIGTVTTGAAGSQAEATMTGTPERPVLNLTIPRGDPGEVTQAELDALAEDVDRNTEKIEDLDEDLTQQKSAIDDLTALTNRKAGMLVDTASGAIASFVPDSTIDNLLGVSVAVEPVQDLNGYDSPWPAGGGKNKLRPLTVSDFDGAETYGLSTYIRLPFAAGTYTVSTDAPTGYIWAGKNLVNPNYQRVYSGTPLTITLNDGDTEILLGILTTDKATALSYNIQIEAGSTATAWVPFENICPISGWDSVEVSNTSTNIWDEEWEVGGYASANGQPWNTTDRIRSKADNYISVLPNTAYYFKTPQNTNVCFYDANKVYIGTRTYINEAFTTPANAYYMRFACQPIYGTTYNHDISINYPATDHAYHPYSGNRYTIPLGDTIYGAKLTIAEDGSVNALIDRAWVDLGTLTWYRNGTYPIFYAVLSDSKTGSGQISTGILSSQYAVENVAWYQLSDNHMVLFKGLQAVGTNSICVRDDRFSDAASFASAMSGVQLCYELATPITIQLDPVTIATIAGQTNNVWADAGDVSVEYAADIKTYIDSKIAAAVAALS